MIYTCMYMFPAASFLHGAVLVLLHVLTARSASLAAKPSSHSKNLQSNICSQGWVGQKPLFDW